MFEKSQGPKFSSVVLTMVDGKELNGELSCGLNGSITSLLNDAGQFVEMKAKNGDRAFISKHQIKTVEPSRVTGDKSPKLNLASFSDTDWAEVLGVSATSSPDQVKEAYHILAKRYHPDLYSEQFPLEIRKYASDRFARINVAYDQFKAQKQAA